MFLIFETVHARLGYLDGMTVPAQRLELYKHSAHDDIDDGQEREKAKRGA